VTWTNITSNLPSERHDVWSIIQDHLNGNLLFAGTEFGVYVTVDGGKHWDRLSSGLPPAQARDMAVQRRENDLVVATFGRGFFVLDDFSALREMNAETLAQDAYLFPLRDAYLYSMTNNGDLGSSGALPMSGNYSTPNPAMGANFTYNVKTPVTGDSTKLVLSITDDGGRLVRRMDLDKSTGLRRVLWNLRADPAPRPASADSTGGRGAGGGGAGGGGGNGFGGRGNAGVGPIVAPGRYRATIGTMVGTKFTPLGVEQTFNVVQIDQ
jgi:hypothetical protein